MFLGNASDVWPGELPPGWELEWVDDKEWLNHGRPPMMWSYRLVIFRCLQWTLNHLLSCQRTMFVIMNPTGMWWLICKALWTLLHESFNAYVRSSLWCQVIYRALTRQHSTRYFFYYCLMTKRSGLGDSTELSQVGLSQLVSEHLYAPELLD
jgi:hypothetical protein